MWECVREKVRYITVHQLLSNGSMVFISAVIIVIVSFSRRCNRPFKKKPSFDFFGLCFFCFVFPFTFASTSLPHWLTVVLCVDFFGFIFLCFLLFSFFSTDFPRCPCIKFSTLRPQTHLQTQVPFLRNFFSFIHHHFSYLFLEVCVNIS